MAGYSAYGTLLGVATSASSLDLTTNPSSWTYIGELTGIGGPSISADTIDVTAHDSSTDAYREFVVGLIDGGDITLEGNLASAAAGNTMVDLLNDRAVINFRVKFSGIPAATTGNDWLLSGIVNSFETDAPHDGKISFSGGLKLTGKPFLTSTYATA